MNCTRCSSENTKKNGHTHYGKQNYYCHNCGSQFVKSGQAWFVNKAERELINKLLLERISLSDLVVPDIESYLSARMDEEIGRIEVIKKIEFT